MTDRKEEGESYTYGSRLVKSHINWDLNKYKSKELKAILTQDVDELIEKHIVFVENGNFYLNQIEMIIYLCKKYGHRNNQLVMQVAKPDDCFLQDPPCLRHIDTRIQDNQLHFFVYFRSWDIYSGLPANLAAIEALQKYMADCIGVKQGEFIVESKGAHIYGYAEKLAKLRCLKDVE